MFHYLVRYSLGPRGEYEYPEGVADVVWNSIVYHFDDQVMIGRTDMKIKTIKDEITLLKPSEAEKLKKKFRASYPKPPPLPDTPTTRRVAPPSVKKKPVSKKKTKTKRGKEKQK